MSFWVAGAAVVGTVAGGVIANRGARSAASTQARSADAAVAEQQRQFDTLLGLTANQRAIGNQALNALGSIYGYEPAPFYEGTGLDADEMNSFDPQAYLAANPDVAANPFFRQYPEEHWLRHGQYEGRRRNIIGDRQESQGRAGGSAYQVMPDGSVRQVVAVGPGSRTGGNQLAGPDYSAFYESPDYRFRLNEGLSAVQNSAAAQGGLYSGNTLRGITEYGQGFAAGEFGNYVNRQLALAGMGQAATTQAGNAALTTGANVGNLLVNQGNARASGIIGQTNAIAGGINDLAQLYGLYRGGYFGSGGGS